MMDITEPSESPRYEEYVVQQPDTVSSVLRYGILFLVATIICLLVYALVVGLFAPPAPRTLIESSITQAQAAVKKSPGSGQAWASLAGAQYASGDEATGWESIALARKRVKDRSILYVNSQELRFLLFENKNEQVVKRSNEFLKVEADYQLQQKAEYLQKGITVPDAVDDNQTAIQLFVFKGTAQGNLGQWKDAVKTFDQALQLDDRAADILTLRGWARLRSGDKTGAKKDFEKALAFLPNDPSAAEGLKAAGASKEPTSTKK